jgi:hypothetical protein
VPTYEVSPEFLALHAELTEEQKKRFRVAVDKFVEDLRKGQGFRPGLRVRGIRTREHLYEMTWAPDGRGVFSYGEPVIEGQVHIQWHAVGTHDVLG